MERAGVSNLKAIDGTGATIERPVWESAALRALTVDQWLILLGLASALAVGLHLAPDAVATALIVGAAIVFLGLAVWRLALVLASEKRDAAVADVQIWPRYTILAALYDETEVLEQLVERLAQIDYPADRLQGLLVLEAHDHDTIQAALDMPRPEWLQVFIAPPGEPHTKPRALNCVLPHVTGDLLTVYDAEDDPDPLQLKEAASRFATDNTGKLVCLQAPLRIRRKHKGPGDAPFLDRQFAAEYAALFETILPGMARLGLPFPLGGTSNHFRVDVLRAVGGWDAFNVTEDADLGFRLWRKGWGLGVITRPTWETPPGNIRSWLPQRTRWLKGYMQTWGTHTRCVWELGPRGVFALVATLGAGLASAILQGPALAWFAVTLAVAAMAGLPPLTPALALSVLGIGTASAWLSCLIGTRRAGVPYTVFDMLAAPLYWSLLSLALVHAVWRLIREPFAWDKTAHRPDVPAVDGTDHAIVSARLDEALPVRLSASHVAAPEPVT
jgi:cellulose synthase/poly-beta-1,6-N-acetylglucosamine synthase-like glycosyltransferase